MPKLSRKPTPVDTQRFKIVLLSTAQAKTFVEEWHYSKRMPSAKNVSFGLLDNKQLYAVIVYGIGINPYQAKFLCVNKVVEIKRLCRKEPKQNYPLSKFIRATMKLLSVHMSYDAIVAFADPEHGHKGGVYKATGFAYEGITKAEWHVVDSDGVQRHRRYAYRLARRKGITIDEARQLLGLTRVKTLPKHRWVLRRNHA